MLMICPARVEFVPAGRLAESASRSALVSDRIGGRATLVPVSDSKGTVRVEVLARPGCHLCELAIQTVAQICAEVGADWIETNIDDDAELIRRYTEMVPVIFVDGTQHDYWRVDPARLRAALDVDR